MNTLAKTVKNWWILLILGLLFIALSIRIFTTPLSSFVGLAILISILVFVDGIANLVFTLSNWNHLEGRGWMLISAIITLFIGIVLISYPGLSVATLPFIVGFWLLFRSVSLISSAIELRGYGFADWGWMLFGGIVLLVFAFLVIDNPVFGAIYVVTYVAIAVLMMGIGQVWLALRLRNIKEHTLDKITAFRNSMKSIHSKFLLTSVLLRVKISLRIKY